MAMLEGAPESGDLCPECGKALTRTVIQGNWFLAPHSGGPPLLRLMPDGKVHLHDVVVMPLGQQRIRPTIKRELTSAYRRKTRGIRRIGARAWRSLPFTRQHNCC